MSENTAMRDDFTSAILTLISVSHIIGATAQYGINTLAPFYQEELELVFLAPRWVSSFRHFTWR